MNGWHRTGLAGLTAAGLVATGCSSAGLKGRHPQVEVLSLYDFEAARVTEDATPENVRHQLITGDGVTSGKQALRVVYPPTTIYKKISFRPDRPWNLEGIERCSVALDITNLSEESAQLFMGLKDATQGVTGHVSIGPGESGTYLFDLAGPNLQLDPGMTGWPPRLAMAPRTGTTRVAPFQYAWGARSLDPATFHQIGLYMKGNLTERTLVVDNLRVVSTPIHQGPNWNHLVDEFGQYTGADWPGKIHSEKELKRQTAHESAVRANGSTLKDRSTFGGWSHGPRLEGSGFFRTAKVDGKWTLVDPEGYLFFASGIANCRLANTPTLTGMDFDDVESRGGAHVASKLRRNLFSWLPDPDDPLAAHYGYAASVHTGPLEQGETFSFYAANLQRKFGTDYLSRWRDGTLDRLQDWGFTCLGNWTDPRFYGNGRVPYFADAWITGDHKRVSTGNDYWGPIHDPFDPAFEQSVRRVMAQVDAEVRGDPWCIGVFVDNELSWGNEYADQNRYGLVINTLAREASECPAKAAFVILLQGRHPTIERLNTAWGAKLDSWETLAAGFEHQGELVGEQRADFGMLSEALASEYFKIVNRELKKRMPNHLYFGARFSDWGLTPEAVRAAARHTDVVSYNLYTEGLPGHFGDWLKELDRPSVLGEFHFGATDRGMFHGGICTASSQADRGRKFSAYLKSVLESPCFVGAHWFQYIDSPTTGRAIDGENYNSGFVSVTDTPYAELVEAARDVNRTLYQRRFGDPSQHP